MEWSERLTMPIELFFQGSLEPLAWFSVALMSVEVCLERTSTAFIEASPEPFASFRKRYVLR
jgi:hypothetical protein